MAAAKRNTVQVNKVPNAQDKANQHLNAALHNRGQRAHHGFLLDAAHADRGW